MWKLVFASPGRDPEARAREASAAKMTQAEKGDAENGKEKGGEKEKEQRGVKRPIVPALVPESLQEQIQSNFIVVIHPGSTTLRIGRATDTLPASIPHVIARRHKQQGQPLYKDNWLLREGLNVSKSEREDLERKPRVVSLGGLRYSLCTVILNNVFIALVYFKIPTSFRVINTIFYLS